MMLQVTYHGATCQWMTQTLHLGWRCVVRGKSEGPLFRFRDRKPLTRQKLVTAVKNALEKAGVDPGQYSGHSFRIGAATTAAARGLEVDIIHGSRPRQKGMAVNNGVYMGMSRRIKPLIASAGKFNILE